MRVVAGRFKGRRLVAPAGTDTRPTTDRVREALFSAIGAKLGPDLGGARVLDPFAGSGALGLEALSRGATWVTFVERDRRALEALRANVASLQVAEQCSVIPGDAISLAGRPPMSVDGPYSLLLLDPPYRIVAAGMRGFLESLASSGALADRALVVWEHAAGTPPEWPAGFELASRKRYGSTETDITWFERGADGE